MSIKSPYPSIRAIALIWQRFLHASPCFSPATQQTHNNKNEPPLPYPPVALPSLSMGRLAAPPNHGAAASYRLMQGARHRVWRRHGWFACLGRQKETHQKIERRTGLLPEVAAI